MQPNQFEEKPNLTQVESNQNKKHWELSRDFIAICIWHGAKTHFTKKSSHGILIKEIE
jgi:hypothetical protein